jgi:hypothetical protein
MLATMAKKTAKPVDANESGQPPQQAILMRTAAWLVKDAHGRRNEFADRKFRGRKLSIEAFAAACLAHCVYSLSDVQQAEILDFWLPALEADGPPSESPPPNSGKTEISPTIDADPPERKKRTRA